jgi:protein TonB
MARGGADLARTPADLRSEGSAGGVDPVPGAALAMRRDLPPARQAAYLHNPPPAYPLIARRNGEQGTVTLRVLVARDGVPANVSLERSSGYTHLDRAALATVKGWRFVPAQERGEPIEAWLLVPIVFRLEGTS